MRDVCVFQNSQLLLHGTLLYRESVNQSHPPKSPPLFRQDETNGLEPNNFTFPLLAKACAKLSNLKLSQIHSHNCYKNHCFSLIYLCKQLCLICFLDKVLCLVHDMRFAGVHPDTITVMGWTQASLATKNLELVKAIHAFGIQIGIEGDVSMANTWISAYSKCNDWSRPRLYLMGLNMGCALNGEYKEALDLFYMMLELGMKPNHLTFLAILQACTHAGKLEEAVELVNNMPMKPDAGIWGALLGACRIHHNIEIGEYACSRLLELEPQVAVPYVEMANIYASERRWDEVAALRTVMKFNKVKKFPGQSLVHVNGKPHVFTVEDWGHPEALRIYAMIGSLDLLSKEEYATLREVDDMIN
ncbi:hypothetical protein M0R45_005250 [Rubus argutus]|uniref:Pentatricopeptide repeat-containing protein n=1 Tax=Rubus argutus TaxID=59490 RepID=A0AAW1YM73_RUBAR